MKQKKYLFFLILIFTIGSLAIGACQNNLFMKKYKWRPGDCAPKGYPTRIQSGNFYYKGGSIYVPDKSVLDCGKWGFSLSSDVVGEDFKPVPHKFDISWLSIAENKFYEGSFKLPEQKIDSLFATGYTDRLGRHATYDELIVGVAPGGIVIVWASGADKTVDIGRYVAQESSITIKELMPYSSYTSVDEYVKGQMENLPNELKHCDAKPIDYNNIPFGLWDSYRKKYNWKFNFQFNGSQKLRVISTDFYNGEGFFVESENSILYELQNHAIPNYLNPKWIDSETRYGVEIYFDEKEIFDAFSKIYDNNLTTEAELVIAIDKYNSKAKVFLSSKTDTVEIFKGIREVYRREE